MDIRNAILDEAFKTEVDGRYTYKRISEDTLEITNGPKSKAKNNAAALKIANGLVQRIQNRFNNMVTGFTFQNSPYDPVTVSLGVNQAYIDYEYNKLPFERRSDPNDFERNLEYFNYDSSLMVQEENTSDAQISRFDTQLFNRIKDILEKKYPEIKLNITNNPIWEEGNDILNQQDYNNEINFRNKVVDSISKNIDKVNTWFKKLGDTDIFWKKVQTDLQIPKNQINILRNLEGNNVEEKLASFIASYSYTIEINIAREPIPGTFREYEEGSYFVYEGWTYEMLNDPIIPEHKYWKTPEVDTNNIYVDPADYVYITEQEFEEVKALKMAQEVEFQESTAYSDMTVLGGTNYKNIEIATPAITPAIKGHAQFSTDHGIGWFRSDDKIDEEFLRTNKQNEDAKTRRILEVQSDLFQKGRDKEDLTKGYEKIEVDDGIFINGPEFQGTREDNNFLQLLNKDNNWVTFFVKSIIQDSARRGYKKVIFPRGDTIGQIEGFATLEEFIRLREGWIKTNTERLNSLINEKNVTIGARYFDFVNRTVTADRYGREFRFLVQDEINTIENRLRQFQREINDARNQGLQYNRIQSFYEKTLGNVLSKQGFNPREIMDEYDNGWYEVNIIQPRDLEYILLQKDERDRIIGQANIRAMTVLIDAINQKQDTLPHEYAHHYIAWFRDSPIVQEGIKRFGSEENLVQAIGEQVVKQKGEANNWWKKFTNWILSILSTQEVLEIITDSFLNRDDLSIQRTGVNIETRVMDVDDSLEGGEMTKTFVRYGNQEVGEILAENDGIYMTVFNTNINGPRNTGTFAYLQLANEAIEKGVQLRSDRISDRLSVPAVRLWERFVRQGLAERVNDHYLFTGNPTEFDEQNIIQDPAEIEDIDKDTDELEENNEDLTQDESSEDTDSELNGKFDELLNKGIISQICR